jgi:hypothetical protein
MSFDEYYKKYLTFHTKPATRWMHVLGNLATVYYIYLCFIYSLWGLVLSPFIIYLFAWPSHLWIERNKPAAFKNPVMAKMADWRMMFDMFRGKL